MKNEIINNDFISHYRIKIHEMDNLEQKKYKQLNHKMICNICGREYWSHKVGRFWVQTCGYCDLYVTCANEECQKENLIIDHPSRVLENIKHNKLSCCNNNCLSKAKIQQSRKKICPICGGNNINIMGICMTCHNKNINHPIICKIHGYQEKSFAGKCIYCINDKQNERLKNLAIKNCEKANNIYWKSKEGIKQRSNIAKKNLIVYDKYCNECKTITLHKGNVCLKCNPEGWGSVKPNFITKNNVKYYKNKELNQLCSDLLLGKEDIGNYPGFSIKLDRVCYNNIDVLTDEKILFQSNFQIKDNIKYYKNKPIEEVIRKLDSGEYNIEDFPGFEKRYDRWTYNGKDLLTDKFYNLTGLFHVVDNVKYYKQTPVNKLVKQLDNNKIEIPPGFNKRFGEWYYNQENILTGEIIKLNGSLFEVKNNIEYYYDKSIDDYIPWKNYKQKFSLLNTDFELSDGFEWYITFREQDSLDWSNARLAFEKNLIENNIGWFVYIKFYYDKYNNIKPLVVGKSGSLNVNNFGSDVSFSTDIHDGPARKFLKENNLDWCKTQIAIIKCKSEKEAYQKENEIQKRYNLFES